MPVLVGRALQRLRGRPAERVVRGERAGEVRARGGEGGMRERAGEEEAVLEGEGSAVLLALGQSGGEVDGRERERTSMAWAAPAPWNGVIA